MSAAIVSVSSTASNSNRVAVPWYRHNPYGTEPIFVEHGVGVETPTNSNSRRNSIPHGTCISPAAHRRWGSSFDADDSSNAPSDSPSDLEYANPTARRLSSPTNQQVPLTPLSRSFLLLGAETATRPSTQLLQLPRSAQSQSSDEQSPSEGGKAKNTRKGAADVAYRTQLTGLMRYVAFPSGANYRRNSSAGGVVPPGFEHCPALFIGQVGFDVSPELLRWVFEAVSNGSIRPVNVFRRAWSCYVVHFRTQEEALLARSLNDRILFDRNGVWIANTVAEQQLLADYCRRLQDGEYHVAGVRLAKRCMVIRK